MTTCACSRMLHTGTGAVIVAFSVDEMHELAVATSNPDVRERLVRAVGLLDSARALQILVETAHLRDW